MAQRDAVVGVIEEVGVDADEQLRITRGNHMGYPTICLWTWRRGKDGWEPTGNGGFELAEDMLPALIEALKEARR
jgi:hypothetical protein